MRALVTPVSQMVGERFGKLVVLAIVGAGAKKAALVRCDCGAEKTAGTSALRDERTKTCGGAACRPKPNRWIAPTVGAARAPKLRINLQRPPELQAVFFRLFSRIKRAPSGCWEWQGSRHPQGHGYFQWSVLEGVSYAHRASWRLLRGEIPEGHGVLHKCDNPPCINPLHLFTGTDAENFADMRVKMRHPHGERQPFAKLTEIKVLEIRTRRAAGEQITRLAKEFGLENSAVCNIASGRNWKHVGGPLTAPGSIPHPKYRRRASLPTPERAP